ncbi:hypothetical protein DBA26_02735 [Brucella canis]|uniref:Uncharacterized protein n=3 Tax=Brucella TaxID=234 RepID=A0AAI8H6J9_BRUSS|nr:hypothetical protein BKD02_10450 [Brucella sp. 09RB8910]ATN21221.1 hypothetical protein CRN66_16245 [Brucella canis]ATQ52267.1 hypothetical protein CS875_06315 [Brucella suis]EEX87656.1 predicted protein [Brucella ceti B1/94]EEY26429.1 predicted protein [Brucella sp. F5/99]EEY32905.1 predicted protein [Brucella suis bv. 3 str. 686]EEZ08844.1 predicted protein [Brucella ceti M490/95/1]EEZ31379.1 predicted protein [Brucella pinnipedialis M292/94/1]MRN45745.1 hypothetical protein [Brucella 
MHMKIINRTKRRQGHKFRASPTCYERPVWFNQTQMGAGAFSSQKCETPIREKQSTGLISASASMR